MQDTSLLKDDLAELKAKGQKIYLCSFGDTRLGISICRFKEQAESMQVFDDIMIYTEASLPLDFKRDFEDKFYVQPGSPYIYYNSGTQRADGRFISRGFGYWVWKPQVILMALEQMKDDDLLVYLDIGCEFNAAQTPLLKQMLKEVDKNEIMGIQASVNAINKDWTRADLLAHFNLLEDKAFTHSDTVVACFIFMKKTARTINIIKEWLDMFYSHFELIDDSPSKIPNFPEFKENRHDQSVWSILNYKHKMKNFNDDYYEKCWNKAIIFSRNKIYLPNNVDEMKHFNESVRKYGFHFDEKILDTQKLKNELESLPVLKQKQELANLKLDESVKKLKVKKLEKELGMKLSKLEPRVVLNLNENLKNSAVARVRNHLAYKRGEALIICSKSFLGLLSLPFVLKFIENKHKKEQAAYQKLIKDKPDLAFKSMQNCRDYNEALKVEQCFTYQLGLAYIKARKTWYKGGFFKFYFEVKRLEREFKNKF